MVMVFLTSIIASTVSSEQFLLSVWGEIPGRDSTAAYTFIIYILFFGLVATHIKTRSQISRMMAGIVIMGVLVSSYGVLQHYGQVFLDIGRGPGRITATVGNAVFAGSLILITTMVTLISAGITLRESKKAPILGKTWIVVIGAHCPIRGTDFHFQPWAVGWAHRWRNFFAHTNRHFCQPPSCGPVRSIAGSRWRLGPDYGLNTISTQITAIHRGRG